MYFQRIVCKNDRYLLHSDTIVLKSFNKKVKFNKGQIQARNLFNSELHLS